MALPIGLNAKESNGTSLNKSAWLQRIEINMNIYDTYKNQNVIDNCVAALMNKGCSIYYHRRSNFILYSINEDLLFVVIHNNILNYGFGIYMMQNTEDNRNIWRREIDKL